MSTNIRSSTFFLLLALTIRSVDAQDAYQAAAGDCSLTGPNAQLSILSGASPLRACQDEQLIFDASDSQAQGNAQIVLFEWSFDGGPWLSGGTAQYTYGFPNGGVHNALLAVTDDNGCTDTTGSPLMVYVSTTPNFTGTVVPSTCEGDSVTLYGMAWSTAATFNGGGGPLPDDQGVPYSWATEVTAAVPGATLTSADQLNSVCVNVWHTFMADLLITLRCPNGQDVVLHQQGGGGVDLGIPEDSCWTYCWSPVATNGTWGDNASSATLPSGTYESLDPMTALEGCPIEGTWTITFIDLWAADEGYLCDWSLNLSGGASSTEGVLPPLIVSGTWSGPGVIPGGTETAVAVPPSIGEQLYTFSVTDDFGCSYDTAISMVVEPMFNVTALVAGVELTASLPADQYQWIDCAAGPIPGETYLSFTPDQDGQYAVQVTLGACTAVSECVEIIGTDVADVSTHRTISIHPNPAQDRIMVRSQEPGIRFLLMETSGRIVKDLGVRNADFSIDVSGLSLGTYVLAWSGGGLLGRFPVIIAR